MQQFVMCQLLSSVSWKWYVIYHTYRNIMFTSINNVENILLFYSVFTKNLIFIKQKFYYFNYSIFMICGFLILLTKEVWLTSDALKGNSTSVKRFWNDQLSVMKNGDQNRSFFEVLTPYCFIENWTIRSTRICCCQGYDTQSIKHTSTSWCIYQLKSNARIFKFCCFRSVYSNLSFFTQLP